MTQQGEGGALVMKSVGGLRTQFQEHGNAMIYKFC